MKYLLFPFFLVSTAISCSSDKSPVSGKDSLGIKPVDIKKQQAGNAWLGKWERSEWQNGASLEITGINNDSIMFSLFASSGGHTGEVDGVAVVNGNAAQFSSQEDSDTCLIQFTLVGDSIITIDQKKGSCFAGLGVAYSGTYKNPKRTAEVVVSPTLLSVGVFKTEQEEAAFKALVGKDYDLFINSTQLTSTDRDLDNLNATVYSSGVRGLFTSLENIIITDSAKNIWAAVIDDNRVLYFTNSHAFKSELPKTIENWRQNFTEYPVIFK